MEKIDDNDDNYDIDDSNQLKKNFLIDDDKDDDDKDDNKDDDDKDDNKDDDDKDDDDTNQSKTNDTKKPIKERKNARKFENNDVKIKDPLETYKCQYCNTYMTKKSLIYSHPKSCTMIPVSIQQKFLKDLEKSNYRQGKLKNKDTNHLTKKESNIKLKPITNLEDNTIDIQNRIDDLNHLKKNFSNDDLNNNNNNTKVDISHQPINNRLSKFEERMKNQDLFRKDVLFKNLLG
jgi:hypothetical protein